MAYDVMLKKVLLHKHSGAETEGGVTGALPPAACSNVRCITQGTTVSIKWADPAQTVELDGVALAEWAKTVLVRKAGAHPENMEDGTVIITSAVHNQYNTTKLVDTLPDTDNTYYYRLFPVSTKNVANMDEANKFVAAGLTWPTIADIVRNGEAQQYFAAGDTITCQHSEYGEITWEIAGFDNYAAADGEDKPSMMLLSEKLITDLQFDAVEKQYAPTADTVFHPEYRLAVNLKGATNATTFVIEDKTATGTGRVWYNTGGNYKLFWHSDRWEIWGCNSGTHVTTSLYDYQSSVEAEPTAGTWNGATVCANGNAYYTFDGTTYNAATVTAGAAVEANTYFEKNPHNDRVNYGYNNWQHSALRQYLNATAAAGQWWQPQHIFDSQPGYAATKRGFLAGFDEEFLAAIGSVKVPTARNTACDCGGSYITEDKMFLASRTEVFNEANNGIVEGSILPIYVGATNADRIKYRANNTTNHWWLRSPYPGLANYVYSVHTSGSLSHYHAFHTNGVAPACVIC